MEKELADRGKLTQYIKNGKRSTEENSWRDQVNNRWKNEASTEKQKTSEPWQKEVRLAIDRGTFLRIGMGNCDT